MTEIKETGNESINDTVVLMATAIAKQQHERLAKQMPELLSAFFEPTQGTDTPKFLISMSNYDCPVCGQPTIQPFSKKWLFFTLKRIWFYKCTNEYCPAQEVTVYPEDVSKAIEAMEDTETEDV